MSTRDPSVPRTPPLESSSTHTGLGTHPPSTSLHLPFCLVHPPFLDRPLFPTFPRPVLDSTPLGYRNPRFPRDVVIGIPQTEDGVGSVDGMETSSAPRHGLLPGLVVPVDAPRRPAPVADTPPDDVLVHSQSVSSTPVRFGSLPGGSYTHFF